MAHPPSVPAASASQVFGVRAWKTLLSTVCAVLLGLLFLVAGVWKITDPLSAATRMTQALLPASLSHPIAIAAGIAETFAGVLLFVPRFRRWGAYLSGLMLIAFLVYFAVNYGALRGADCSCFPWLKRVVGPGFFISDGIMLLMAIAAGWWARPSWGTRSAAVILGAVSVFALASYGVAVAGQTGLKAPDSITVDGKPYSLQQGRIVLYFFDPECSHCWRAAQKMGTLQWNDVKIVAIPVVNPQYAQQFLAETGLKAAISTDVATLRETFRFVDAPYAVALEHGRQKAALPAFDDHEPWNTLRSMGYIE